MSKSNRSQMLREIQRQRNLIEALLKELQMHSSLPPSKSLYYARELHRFSDRIHQDQISPATKPVQSKNRG